MNTRVKIINEVPNIIYDDKRHLYFQKCNWIYENGEIETGYRFIWRDRKGKLLSHRGQARIPNKANIDRLINLAIQAGWYE